MAERRDHAFLTCQGITSDLFPGVKLPKPDYDQMNIAVELIRESRDEA